MEPPAAGRADGPLDDLSGRHVLRLAARAPDSYVLLLLLLVVDYVLISVGWSGTWALFCRSIFLLLTLLLAFHTSRVSQRVQNAVRFVAALAALVAFGAALSGGDTVTGAATLLISLLLVGTPVAIGWRIMHHEQVTAETLAGAVCVYVLIGMIFANFDYGIQLASGNGFFAQSGHHGLPDFAYFSYITMTTVGYGDLTPTTGFPRTMSVLEALTGQVFLVVMLARLVSMYRGPVGWRRGLQERLQGPAGPPPAGPPDA